jgi:phospholipase C
MRRYSTLKQENWEGQVYETLPPDPDNRMPAGLPNTPFDFNIVLERMPKNASWPGIPITHRYYFEQWQINDGKMNRFVNFSSAEGITMSYFDVTNQYFGQLAQNYTLLDNFYHSAFGGSFLNHQFLVRPFTILCAKQSKSNFLMCSLYAGAYRLLDVLHSTQST